jgi:hypothetical protein
MVRLLSTLEQPVKASPQSSSPIVVGGIGGSGTRVVVNLLQAAGVVMGSRLNGSLDLLDFVPLLDAHVQRLLGAVRAADYKLTDLGASGRDDVATACREVILRLQREAGGQAWGWKNPRIIYLLPFVCAVVPQMLFVHVVRDGRDMALSGNQQQLRAYGRHILGHNRVDVVASACFWQRVNATVAAWCHRHLTGRYICLRYEDLLHDPASNAGRLLDFIALARPLPEGGRVAAIESWHARLVASPGIGRWRTAAPSLQESIFQGCAEGLSQFGYLASGGTNRQPTADGSCTVGAGEGMP